MPEPVLLGTQYNKVSITPSYGIFFIAGGENFTVNSITSYYILYKTGFLENDRVSYRHAIVIASPQNNLITYGDNNFVFAPNSFGQKLSSVTQAIGTGTDDSFSIYKLADIQ